MALLSMTTCNFALASSGNFRRFLETLMRRIERGW
jgi:hypothetical protein